MLVRRFTIVCLLTTLFGMFFAILVADAGRATRPRRIAEAIPCLTEAISACRPASQH